MLRAYRRRFAGACGLGIGGVLAMFVFHGCDADALLEPTSDSGTDEGASVVLPEPEPDATPPAKDPCARILEPSADCIHPPVVKSCDGGWCRIPHGCFIMGSPPCEYGRGLYDEDQVQVTLTHDFEIQQTEMTQAEWTALGLPNPSRQIEAGTAVNEGGTPVDESYGDCLEPTCPVGNVTVEDAMMAANKLSEKAGLSSCYALSGCTGVVGDGFSCTSRELTTKATYECLGYRLPNEAEWEYAVRAGTKTAFYDGDVAPINDCKRRDPVMDAIGWYCFNSGFYSHPVGQKKPNPWGLFDVAGNAIEWTTSDYTGAGYGPDPLVDPWSKIGTECLDLRGGTANYLAEIARSAERSQCVRGFGANARGPLVGFRLVRTLP